MDFFHRRQVHGIDGGPDQWATERPPKRLRTSKSHAAILQPVRRLVRSPLDTLSTLAESLGYGGESKQLSADEQERRLQLLRLNAAETLDEWQCAAIQLDQLENANEWKEQDESDDYDYELIRSRLERLEKARDAENMGELRFLIRTSLTRDLGGMGNVNLYKHSRIGTKALIERYIKTVVECIQKVVASAHMADRVEIHEELKYTRQSYGRSALLLSGGAILGMNHIGVVKALFEANALPNIISGASAGSIVCAVLCTRTDEEILGSLEQFCEGELDVFEKEDEDHSIFAKVTRFFTQGAVYDIENLIRVMKNLLGTLTFREAYNRTGRILNIGVSSAGLYETPRLLNYITCPNVMIWSAVAASCSVPFVFSSADLQAKDPKTNEISRWTAESTKLIDGSVDNDLPMTRLAEMWNVNHFIVSQVNPHVVPFLAKEEDDEASASSSFLSAGTDWVHALANLAKGEALHRMHVLAELGFFPTTMTKLRSVLGQRYSGDVTIIPEISYTQFPNILSNPTPDFMRQAVANGERATWPKLSRIRNHLAIELQLDAATKGLYADMAFSQSQADLRKTVISQPNGKKHGRRRRGSRASHNSARSTIVPREVPGRGSLHRPIKSMVEPAEVQMMMAPKESGPSQLDYFSSANSSSTTLTTDLDKNDSGVSETSMSPPESPEPLFPSASQPVTPSVASKYFVLNTPTATRMPAAKSPGYGSSLVPPPNVSISPEAKYKRLFHQRVQPMQTIRSQTSTPEPQEHHRVPRKFNKLGLNLDFSGTKDMVQKQKRSLSTGLKSLRPPERQ